MKHHVTLGTLRKELESLKLDKALRLSVDQEGGPDLYFAVVHWEFFERLLKHSGFETSE